jgi:hypothetical protein
MLWPETSKNNNPVKCKWCGSTSVDLGDYGKYYCNHCRYYHRPLISDEMDGAMVLIYFSIFIGVLWLIIMPLILG